MGKILFLTSWGYLFFVTSLCLAMVFAGDRWWPATLVMFGPRWVTALPLVILVPLAAWCNWRLLFPVLAGALVVFGPLMGFVFSAEKAVPVGPVLRVLTCNIDAGSCNVEKFAALVQNSQADIVALQECPHNLKLQLPVGWQIIQGKGLAVLSRFPLEQGRFVEVVNHLSRWPMTCMLHCVVKAPGGDLAFCSVHMPTVRKGLDDLLDKKTFIRPTRKGLLLKETEYRGHASREVQHSIASLNMPIIIAGDFNMPMESSIYRSSWKRYENAFSSVGFGYGWTAWRGVRWLRQGIRIDHVLTGGGVKPLLCEVGPDVGSDHLPVIADVAVVRSH